MLGRERGPEDVGIRVKPHRHADLPQRDVHLRRQRSRRAQLQVIRPRTCCGLPGCRQQLRLGLGVRGHHAAVVDEGHRAQDAPEQAAVDVHQRQHAGDPVVAHRRQAGRVMAQLAGVDLAPAVQVVERAPGLLGEEPVPPGGLVAVDHVDLHVRSAFPACAAVQWPPVYGLAG